MLNIQGVSASYGKSPVLDSINMYIGPGEAVTLLGRNGVGKSTLLRTIVGHHPVSQGSISFLGKDVTQSASYRRARLGIGYVPQGRGIFPHLSVEENLRLGTAAAGKNENRSKEDIPDCIYELFPVLRRVSHRKGGVLSGGEQQQLAIARAMVAKPKLLILDEPTEGIQNPPIRPLRRRIKNWYFVRLIIQKILSLCCSLFGFCPHRLFSNCPCTVAPPQCVSVSSFE